MLVHVYHQPDLGDGAMNASDETNILRTCILSLCAGHIRLRVAAASVLG